MQTNDWYPNAIRCTTPWQDPGAKYGRVWPSTVNIAVQHHTAATVNSTIGTFGPTSSRHVSAHLLIARDGKVYQFVPFSDIAWHAGDRQTNINSVGIEHEQYEQQDPNDPTQTLWTSWPDIQLQRSAEVQKWLKDQMPEYVMRPHYEVVPTNCPGNLSIDAIKQRMQSVNPTPSTYKDPLTGIQIYGGMAARWYQLMALLGPEIFLVVGHITEAEYDGRGTDGELDGSRVVEFEHVAWRWKAGQSPERYDILADIIHPFGQ